MNKTMKKILKFKEYSEGWNYGRGKTFSDDAIESALAIEILLRRVGIPETDAFPGSDGDIMVTGYDGSLYWEFTLEWDNTVTFITEKDDRIVEEYEGLSLRDVVSKILSLASREEITEKLWKEDNSFVFSTSKDSTIPYTRDLKALSLSQILQEESPLSKFYAYNPEGSPSAPTSENITQERLALRSSFGNLMQEFSHKDTVLEKNQVLQGTNVIVTSTVIPEMLQEDFS